MCVSKSCHFLLLQNLGIMLFSVPWGRLFRQTEKFPGIGDDADVESSFSIPMETVKGFQPVFFRPRRLKNLGHESRKSL